jgi:hypothetical protein
MASQSIEERLTALEAEVAQLKELLANGKPEAKSPWWERRFGAFKDDPDYEEAMRLGAEYRRSQPTPADEGDVSA